MSVKRYDIQAYSFYDAANWETVESEVGDFVHASDYDEFRDCVAWMLECEYMYRMRDFLTCGWAQIEIDYSFHNARKAVEDLL